MKDILLLHGAIGAKDQLQPLTDQLKNKYIVHTLNFSGHGGEPFKQDFSISHFANEVKNYLQEQHLGSINIFGYSMGGYVALYLAKQNPELVDKIITLATKFNWDETIAARETKMLDPHTIMEKVPAFAQQLEKRHAPNDWKMVLEKTKQMLIGLGQKNALSLNDYKTISHRCLILLGEKDKMVTVEETVAVQQALPNADFKSLSNIPHPIEQVNSTELAPIIGDFVG